MAEYDYVMSPRQMAEYLGVSVHTVYSWRRKGKGPVSSKTSSRFIRYRKSDVDAWLGVCPDCKELHGDDNGCLASWLRQIDRQLADEA